MTAPCRYSNVREFHAVGCQVELPRKDMSDHKRQSVAEHSVLLSATLQKAMAQIATLQNEKADVTSLQGAMGDITTLQSEKAGVTLLQAAVADTTSLQSRMQSHITKKNSAMQDSLDKIRERMITQNKKICVGIVLLAIVTVVALATALFAVVTTMQNGQHSMSGKMTDTKSQTDFCTFDNCKVEKSYVSVKSREDWHKELDSKMEQEQRKICEELDIRIEQEQKERRKNLGIRMEQEHKERHIYKELNSRMEQEQRERRKELDRKVEEVMLQVKEYDSAERQERQEMQEQLRELWDKLDQEIKKTEIKNSHEVVDVDISMLQVRQIAILKHLQMIPHEDILPFEFEMKDFEKYRKNRDLWHSPPFYTDINGYKMCIRVEASGKDRTYASVTVFLMTGVADDDLKWPFREDIKIELLNQASRSRWNPLSYFSKKKESHVRTFEFKTARILKSNQRVIVGERAVDGLRIARFIAHDKLEYDSGEGTQYLKYDTLKFRISASSASY